MKYCEEYAALLDLFVDGELSLEEMLRVQEHLDTCPACRAYVDDALAMSAAFPDAEIPTTTSSAVMPYSSIAPLPFSYLSSAFSLARNIHSLPPAMMPCTCSAETPKVGGHSDASSTPSLPDVPAPM